MPRGHGSSEGHVVHKRCEIYHAIEHAELVCWLPELPEAIPPGQPAVRLRTGLGGGGEASLAAQVSSLAVFVHESRSVSTK